MYVGSSGSNRVFIIGGNFAIAIVTFNVSPPRSGYIDCGGNIAPTKDSLYMAYGTPCIAKPNKGFEFTSWEENLSNNSTQLIAVSSSPSITFFNLITSSLDSIINFLGLNYTSNSIRNYLNMEEYEHGTKLTVTKFGTFTANFRELPASIPSEYWIPLYGLIPGFFIPSIIKWLSGKRQRKNLREYLDKMGKVDRHIIEKEILTSYSKRKISDFHYQMLKDKISQYYENNCIDT